MEDQLYLMEVLIDNIYFEETVRDIPLKKQLVVSVKLGPIVTLEIRSEVLPTGGEGKTQRNIQFQAGKSYLCMHNTDQLIEYLDRTSLEVHVGVKGNPQPIGLATVPWHEELKNVVISSKESSGYIDPVTYADRLPIMESDTNEIKGQVDMYLRLSAFGRSIQTHFELNQEVKGGAPMAKQYLFKSRNAATTFSCQMYGAGLSSEMIPIAPLFMAGSLKPELLKLPTTRTSWMAIFDTASLSSKQSAVPSEFVMMDEYLPFPITTTGSDITYDIVSIRIKPNREDKFLNIRTGQTVEDDWDTVEIQLKEKLAEENESLRLTDGSQNKSVSAAESMEATKCSDRTCRAKQVRKSLEDETVEETPTVESTIEEKVVPKRVCNCQKKKPQQSTQTCSHLLAVIRHYEKCHPDLQINGRKVNYAKIFEKDEKEQSAKKNSRNGEVLRLRGGGNDEQSMEQSLCCVDSVAQPIPPTQTVQTTEPKKPRCNSKVCPLGRKLLELKLTSLDIKNKEHISNLTNCKDERCVRIVSTDSVPVDFNADNFDKYKLCSDKRCPAAPKFKKYGMGPLATGKGLGTVYGPTVVPVKYGLSNTYGIMDYYGPYGILTKYNRAYATEEELQDKSQPLRLKGGGPSKSPVLECQEVMEQFDRILGEYRKALGPCGQPSCGYAPNVAYETCAQSCPPGAMESMTLAQMQEGCGAPGCAYSQYKKGLMDVDADIEAQFIAPAIIGNCGHPKCTYKTETALPPIHWDCPDPLPTGPCKNPSCPYKGTEVNLLQDLVRDGPCGSRGCAYKLPPGCPVPSCPLKFSKRPPPPITCGMVMCSAQPAGYQSQDTIKCEDPYCFYTAQTNAQANTQSQNRRPSGEAGNKPCGNPECPFDDQEEDDDGCDNPDCPFNQKGDNDECDNPDCPFRQQESGEICQNQECPFKDQEQSIASLCQNLSCPFNVQKQKGDDMCENPTCPFRQQEEPADEVCDNPGCPFKQEPSTEICANPGCPFKQEPSTEICGNPECPFKEPSNESCPNPDCPYKQESLEICQNPECPFKPKEESVTSCDCGNPSCPFTKKPLAACENPECPFNKPEDDLCKNPCCPYRAQAIANNQTTCGSPVTSYCGDPECPYFKVGGGGAGVADQTGASASPLAERSAGDRGDPYDNAPCTIKTCLAQGGTLKCEDCGKAGGSTVCPSTCPGNPDCNMDDKRKNKIKQRRPEPSFQRTCKRKKNYVYSLGDNYPGCKVGHRECVIPYFMVPPKMGWLWNIHTPCMSLKPRRGWRPGAISKTVARKIRAHRKAKNMPPLNANRGRKPGEESELSVVEPKPTLQIKKREGVYYITMNPLKDPKNIASNENPYMDCTPMQFKITKNKEDYRTCICNDDGEITTPGPLSESSDSELDIEFTPPAGIIHKDRFVKKRNVVHCDTQYDSHDYALKMKSSKSGGSQKAKKGGKKGGKKKKK